MSASVNSVSFYNGVKMPLVGLGSATGPSDEISAAIDAALEAGYRHIDTAYAYHNEAAIGKALKKWLDSGRINRNELFITTKLPQFGNRAERVEKYLKKSLEALQLSYVDLYLVHFPVGFAEQEDVPLNKLPLDPTTDHLSIWKAMEAQVDAGRARTIGLSNFNARQIKRIVKAARIRPANLQVELHIYLQQRELVAFCKALDITVCAYAPLGSPSFREFLKKVGTQEEQSGIPAHYPLTDPAVLEAAQKHGKTPAQVLMRHTIQRGIAAIPKSVKPDRLRENFQVFDFLLDEDDMEKLNGLDKGVNGRVFNFSFIRGKNSHPEYPFDEPY